MKREKRIAIVTGAAGGIGRGIAQRLVQDGASVVIADLPETNGFAIANDIQKSVGEDCIFIPTDVTNEESVTSLINQTIDKFGRIDILVNNAGILTPQIAFESTTVEYFDNVVSVNLKGVFLCIKHAVGHMKKQKDGSIITISSTAGIKPREGMVPYSASKAGAILATQVAAKEFAEYGVRANIIAPGAIDIFGVTEELREVFIKSMPNKRLGRVSEIASLVSFLASEEARQITGAVIPMDGGRVIV